MSEPLPTNAPLVASDPSTAILEAEVRSRLGTLWWVGILVLVTIPADRFRYNPHPTWSLVVRGAMISVCWLAASQHYRFGVRTARRLNALAAFLICSLFCLLTVISGGVDSANFVWTLVLPIAGVVIAGDTLWFAIPFSLLNAAVAGVLVESAGLPTNVLLNEVVNRLSTGAIAVVVALLHRRLRERLVGLAGELREAKERVLQSQRLAFVGQLAAGVAHEINNPLSFVLSSVEYVREEFEGSENPDILTALDDAVVGSQRIRQIVGDLKELSRADDSGEADHERSCELMAALDEAVRLAGHLLRGVQIDRPRAPLPPVRMPHHRMVQILVNLMGNAAEAIAERERTDGVITLRAEAGAAEVLLDVADNGPGFQPGQVEKLFTPFYTTKIGTKAGSKMGMGLGLALCHAYIERFGGTITAQNAPDGGALFRIRLMRAQAPVALPS